MRIFYKVQADIEQRAAAEVYDLVYYTFKVIIFKMCY